MTKKSGHIQYPKWAPAELCEYHKQWVTDQPDFINEAFRDLELLIFDDRMRSIWEKLKKLAVDRNVEHYPIHLLVNLSPDGLFGIDQFTRAELREYVREIDKKSRELLRLVNKVMPFTFINDARGDSDILVVSVLKNLGAQARHVLDLPRTITKPRSETARTYYFVRKLAVFFENTFGDSLKSIVAEMHTIFLPDIDAIGVRDVWRILKNSPLKHTD